MTDAFTSKNRSLPLLLREAERRVNAHVFRRGGDDSLASIPANVDRDVDLLLMEAAAEIERLTEAVADKESDCARLHSALMDAKYPETAQVETPVPQAAEVCPTCRGHYFPDKGGKPCETTRDVGWMCRCGVFNQPTLPHLICTDCGTDRPALKTSGDPA